MGLNVSESWKPRLLLLAILLLAFGMRAWRLPSQSVWSDEFDNICALHAENFATYYAQTMHRNIDYPPGYFLLQWGWSRIFGISALGLRLFCIGVSLLTIALLYRIGRILFNAQAGLIAALCCALSPTHLFYSQEIAPFALLTFFQLLAIYTLIRAAQTNRFRWWTANLLSNIAVMLLHASGPVILFPQGCFVLYYFGKRLDKTLLYTLAQSIPLFVIYFSLQQGMTQTVPFFEAPDFSRVLKALFGSDVIAFTHNILPAPTAYSQLMRPLMPALNYALTALFLLTALWGGLLLLHTLRNPTPPRKKTPVLLLFAITLLPVPLIALMAFAWKVNWETHYWLYAMLGLYLFFGSACAALPKPWMRRTLLGALLLLMGAQMLLVAPATTRTNWKALTQHIQREATEHDIVFAGATIVPAQLPLPLLRFHFAAPPWPLYPETSLQAICDKSAAYLKPFEDQAQQPSAWAVLWLSFASTWKPPSAFFDCIASRGLVADGCSFPAQAGLYLFRIQNSQEGLALPPHQDMPLPPDYDKIQTEIAARIDDPAQRESALGVLPRIVSTAYSGYAMPLFWAGYCQQAFEENLPLAIALGRYTLTQKPAWRLPHMLLAMALWQSGEPEEAREHIDAFMALRNQSVYPLILDIYEPMLHALAKDDRLTARREAQKLFDIGTTFLPRAFLAELGLLPPAPFKLGPVPAALDQLPQDT